MATSSILCQLNGGCMGCCGHDFPSQERIKEAIKKNTLEFNHHNPQAEEEFISFRDRRLPSDLRSGVCRNLIEEKGCFLCPLHPARHQKDLRIGHCDVDYLCKTAKKFETWTKEEQDKFVQFIHAKRLDNITYSMKMDTGELLKEFESDKV